MKNTADIENAILATYIYADDMGIDKSEAFTLDSKVFTSSYRRAVAEKLNTETDGDKNYGYVGVEMEDMTAGTSHEQCWIDILAQTPLTFSFAGKYYTKLIGNYEDRIASEFR